MSGKIYSTQDIKGAYSEGGLPSQAVGHSTLNTMPDGSCLGRVVRLSQDLQPRDGGMSAAKKSN
ncbi:hypothetical protein CR513_21388, partial [Mucuna pruriens]